MNMQGERDLRATRAKLRSLEEHYRSRLAEPARPTHARELSLRSLKRMINQLTEEIARYESHAPRSAGK